MGIFVAVITFVAQLVKITLEYTHVLPCGCANIMTCVDQDSCIPLNFSLDSEIEVNGVTYTNDFRMYRSTLQSIIIAITVVVVAIPEGLPLAVTISLSFSSA